MSITNEDNAPGVAGTAPATRGGIRRAFLLTLLVLVALAIWVLIYSRLSWFAEWYTYDKLLYPRPASSNLAALKDCCPTDAMLAQQGTTYVRQGRGIVFLLFQLPHTFMLLSLVVFLMGIVRSFFTPERTRRLLAGRRGAVTIALGAALGVVTPFCSCSALPLFIGFLTAGVPLGATFAFLTSAPLVNEFALSMLFEQYGLTLAGIYLAIGLTIAILTGWLISRLRMERFLEDWVRQAAIDQQETPAERITWEGRIYAGWHAVREIMGRVWIFILAGIIIGAVIHCYVTQQQIVALLGAKNWWSVPLATLVGVPIYSNPAGILPVMEALRGKGIPQGTLLAFMMGVIALSLPEFLILRRVMKLRLILLFFGIVAAGIMLVGFACNMWVK